MNLGEEGREDLGGREGRGEGVDDAEGRSCGNVLVEVGRFWLRTDGEEGLNDGAGQVERLDL